MHSFVTIDISRCKGSPQLLQFIILLTLLTSVAVDWVALVMMAVRGYADCSD